MENVIEIVVKIKLMVEVEQGKAEKLVAVKAFEDTEKGQDKVVLPVEPVEVAEVAKKPRVAKSKAKAVNKENLMDFYEDFFSFVENNNLSQVKVSKYLGKGQNWLCQTKGNRNYPSQMVEKVKQFMHDMESGVLAKDDFVAKVTGKPAKELDNSLDKLVDDFREDYKKENFSDYEGIKPIDMSGCAYGDFDADEIEAMCRYE